MVIILRGVSGSGKSSLARFLVTPNREVDGRVNDSDVSEFMWDLYDNSPASRSIFSADDYFMQNGEYLFDPGRLSIAHNRCLKSFTEAIQTRTIETTTLIVDNANCTIAEVAPYAALTAVYSHELRVITLVGDPGVCYERGHHGVSFSVAFRQDMELRKSIAEWPPWFHQQIFPIL